MFLRVRYISVYSLLFDNYILVEQLGGGKNAAILAAVRFSVALALLKLVLSSTSESVD